MSPLPETHLFLCAADSEMELRAELADSFSGITVETHLPLLLGAEFPVLPRQRLPYLAFVRQWLPGARRIRAQSIRAWADLLFQELVPTLPPEQPWLLHVAPHYGATEAHHIGARAWHSQTRFQRPASRKAQPASGPDRQAGLHRCALIQNALLEQLQRKRRHLLRRLRQPTAPFQPNDSLLQLLMTGPEEGFVSLALAPLPFEQRHLLSPYVKGNLPVRPDKAAPSRAFAKLLEAEQRLGRPLRRGQTCVDLGAAPGSWTYVAAQRGLQVIAVDRSPLRADLMADARVTFQPGDAFGFEPARPVDWLLCDVIAPPERSAELLLHWLRRGWCRHWVVTLKLQANAGSRALRLLKDELPGLAAELFITRLCVNKKEVCVFGSVARLTA